MDMQFSTYQRTGHISIHPDALFHRPRIGTILAEFLNAHSRSEAQLACLFGSLLDVSEDIALDLFLVCKSSPARSAMYKKLFDERLTEARRAEVKTLMNEFDRLSKIRDMFAHGIWAVASDCSEYEILLISQENLIRWIRAANFFDAEKARDENGEVIVPDPVNQPSAMIFSEKQLGQLMEEMDDLSGKITNLVFDQQA